LLFVGDQFRQAIGRYYQKGPGVQAYPKDLEALVEDKRNVVPQHWLRKLYADPLNHSTDWGVVEAPRRRLMRLHSSAEETPVRSGSFRLRDEAFKDATKYSDWKFVFLPPNSPTGLDPAADKSAAK